MNKYDENFIKRISFEDYLNITKMVERDFKRQNNEYVGNRAFIKFNNFDYDMLEEVHGKNGNNNAEYIIFDEEKQFVYVGKEKDILVNLFTYIREEGYLDYDIKDNVVSNRIIFDDDMIIVDCVIESWNTDLNYNYLNTLFITYNDLFKRFFTISNAEALAVLSTSFACMDQYDKLIDSFFDRKHHIDLLFNTHCTDEILIKLLKETNSKIKSPTITLLEEKEYIMYFIQEY